MGQIEFTCFFVQNWQAPTSQNRKMHCRVAVSAVWTTTATQTRNVLTIMTALMRTRIRLVEVINCSTLSTPSDGRFYNFETPSISIRFFKENLDFDSCFVEHFKYREYWSQSYVSVQMRTNAYLQMERTDKPPY